MPQNEALAAWREVLGPDRVLVGGPRLEQAGQATFAATQRLIAILEPETRDEVAACLRIAQRFRAPVYPVSGGRNWGYGSQVPPQTGAALLSLARLNRIIDYREDLAYVTVEPGVTFGMLAQFLRSQSSRLLPPLTGTTPDASVIGNVLERGIGKGPYEEMAAHSCGYEVVLPTGEILQTGFAGFPGARAAPLRAHGPGPSLQGLFSQSNLGVVTRLTLWLEPAPALRQRLFFGARGPADLPPLIDTLRSRLLRSGTGMQAELINDYRVLSMQRQFPFAWFDGSEALPRQWVQEALGPAGGARWFGCATVWADSPDELAWRRKGLLDALPHAGVAPTPEEPAAVDTLDLLQDGLHSTYWRKRTPAPADPDPDRDRCGVIWLAPVLPMLGQEATEALGQIEQTMLEAGFEPSISLRMVGGRAIQAIIGLLFDRDEPGADQRAATCHKRLRLLLERRGLFPYRLGLLDMEEPPQGVDTAGPLLRSLKRMVDPHAILAPGRYITPEEEDGDHAATDI